ncbi:MAG: hypothetical protein AAF362_12620, partial [Pseudomonadota bacterium]
RLRNIGWNDRIVSVNVPESWGSIRIWEHDNYRGSSDCLSDLDDAGRRYQVVFTSDSAAGVRAAVQAGIAAGLLNSSDQTDGLRPLPGIGTRHSTYLVLQRANGAKGPICDAMSEVIRTAFTG